MNNELLARIERLERAVREIWASCACLRKDEEPDDTFNCEPPGCEDCGKYNCVCEPEEEFPDEEPEEPEEYIEEEDHD